MSQSQKPDEIIVSNDRSTDETKAILDRLASEIPILKIVHQAKNLGMVNNTNFCLRLAKSDFIVKLDSDDYLLPKYIETLTALLSSYPDAGYAHAAVNEVDQLNNISKTRRLFRKKSYHTSEEALRALCKGYKVAANIIMFRRSALEAAGFITSNVNFGEDYYLSVEIANAGFGNIYSDEVLSCYRVWNDNGNVRQKRKLNEINCLRIIFDQPIRAAYIKRGWDLRILENKKTQFACNQSDCLTWDIFNQQEKDELEIALYRLSPANKVKLFAYLHKTGFGKFVLMPSRVMRMATQIAKRIMFAY